MRTGLLCIFLWAIQGFAAFTLTWGVPAISLDSNPPLGDSDVAPSIAIDPFGNAVATWGRTAGGRAIEDIWASAYNHSARVWTGAVKLSKGNASNATVAMDPMGNAILVWEEGFPTQILFRTLSTSGVWTPPLVSPATPIQGALHPQTFPHVAVDKVGNAVAIWMELVEGKNQIRSARKPFGGGWNDLGIISLGIQEAELRLPTPLVINAAGNGMAVWEESNSEIHGACYVAGKWMSPIRIASGRQPSVGVDAAGNGVIVWNQDQVIQSRTMIDGSLSSPLTVSLLSLKAQHPCVGVDDAGNAVVVFERYDSGVLYKFIAGASLPFNGTAWSRILDISGPSPAEMAAAGFPRLALNAIGDGVVVWKEFNGEKMIIQGAGYSLGTWSLMKTLSSLKDNSGFSACAYDFGVSVNLAGNIIAVWPEDPTGADAQHIKVAPGAQQITADPSAEPIAADAGAQHIKAAPGMGLAINSPLPPIAMATDPENPLVGIGTGRQVVHRLPAHADRINLLNWSSPEGNIAYYRIYRGNFFTLIGTSQTPSFEDHQRVPREKVTYLITSVDSNEQESSPITIVVHPKTK